MVLLQKGSVVEKRTWFLGRWAVRTDNGQLSSVMEYLNDDTPNGLRLIFGGMTVEEVEVRTLRPEEIPPILRDPAALAKK